MASRKYRDNTVIMAEKSRMMHLPRERANCSKIALQAQARSACERAKLLLLDSVRMKKTAFEDTLSLPANSPVSGSPRRTLLAVMDRIQSLSRSVLSEILGILLEF